VVDPEQLAKLLGMLHANGYRLRKLGPDLIELDDEPRAPGQGAAMATDQDLDELERKESEEVVWAHVGGRPPGLRRPEEEPVGTPWADEERPKQ
jgi:hypothetical protein